MARRVRGATNAGDPAQVIFRYTPVQEACKGSIVLVQLLVSGLLKLHKDIAVCAGICSLPARTMSQRTWWKWPGKWTCSTSRPYFHYIPCWMTLEQEISSSGSMAIQAKTSCRMSTGKPLQSGSLLRDHEAREPEIGRMPLDLGRHLRPGRMRAARALRRPRRCRVRRCARHTHAFFAVVSFFQAFIESRSFVQFFQFFSPAQLRSTPLLNPAPHQVDGRPGPKSRNGRMPRLNSVVVASIVTFSKIGSVAAMPSPVDTRVGGSPHQEPPEAQCRPRPPARPLLQW